jgi:tetratricopeptide (TPR) repeat protein
MPQLAACADVERLEAEVAPPATLEQRASVDTVRRLLSNAIALEHAGRSREALELATTVLTQAAGTAYAPVIADAALERGRILIGRNELDEATATLSYARTTALEHGLTAVAVEAGARGIFAEGLIAGDRTVVDREAALLVPLSKSLVGDHFAGPLLLNNLGTVYMAVGDRPTATRYFREAREAIADVPQPDLELTCIDKNLAMLTPDDAAREALARGVWERRRAALGDTHLLTVEALDSYARYTADPARALSLLVGVCNAFETTYPELVERRVYCESYLAFLEGLLGDHGEERRHYQRVSVMASQDEQLAVFGRLAAGHVDLSNGDQTRAIIAWNKVVAADGTSPRWWERVWAAHAQFALASAKHAMGKDVDALHHLEAALASYGEVRALTEEVEFRFRLEAANTLFVKIKGDHR